MTIDDLMALRTINDVKISPSGDRVAYTVSTPSVERNAHETALFVIPATGGTPKRLAEIAAYLHPRVAGAASAMATGRQDDFGARRDRERAASARGDPRDERRHLVTAAPAGVSAYEWSPDGQSIAYFSRDAAAGPPPIANKVGANPPATRLWVQPLPLLTARPRALTPPNQYVDSFSWSPSSTEIAYSFAPSTGFLAPYSTKIFAVTADGVASRAIIDRRA